LGKIGVPDFGDGYRLSKEYFQNRDLLVIDSVVNPAAKSPWGDQVVVSVFGSATTDRFRPESDFDELVEIEPGQTRGMHGILCLDRGLPKLFRRLAA
jgi:hypothetical protein